MEDYKNKKPKNTLVRYCRLSKSIEELNKFIKDTTNLLRQLNSSSFVNKYEYTYKDKLYYRFCLVQHEDDWVVTCLREDVIDYLLDNKILLFRAGDNLNWYVEEEVFDIESWCQDILSDLTIKKDKYLQYEYYKNWRNKEKCFYHIEKEF